MYATPNSMQIVQVVLSYPDASASPVKCCRLRPVRVALILCCALTLGAAGAVAQQDTTGVALDTTEAPLNVPTNANGMSEDTSDVQRVDLEADSLIGATEGGQTIRRLVGNVRVEQGTTRLRSQEATQYVAEERILFIGDVRVVDQGDSLWADRIRYDTQRKIGEARSDVHLSDGEVDVYAPSARYFVDEKRAVFEETLRLVDSLTVLTSQEGVYWSDEQRALFYDSVRVVDPEATLAADTVRYDRKTRISRAYGDVRIVRTDPADDTRTVAYGTQAFYEPDADYSRLTGRPLVVQVRRDSTAGGGIRRDTLAVRARQLEWSQRDSLHRLTAVDSVRLWQSDLAATADSAVFDRFVDSTGQVLRQELRLFHEPSAWTNNAQITADTLRFIRHPGIPDSLFASTSAFVGRHDTTLQRIQQIQGRQVVVLLEDDSLQALHAGPQAEAIYYLSEEDRSNGAVRVSGDSISFAFDGDNIRRVRVLSGIEGQRYPEDGLPSAFRLSNYVWRPEQRPQKRDVLRRTSPPDVTVQSRRAFEAGD